MVEPNINNYDSPKKKSDSSSESEQAAASLQMVTISSPRSQPSHLSGNLSTVKASPQKRESSRLATFSPVKGSPRKKIANSKETECSPRKDSSSAVNFSPLKNSSRTLSPAAGSQHKPLITCESDQAASPQFTTISSPKKKPAPQSSDLLTVNKSPQKRESSRLAALSPIKGSPLKRNANLTDSECSPRKRSAEALDLSSLKTSPLKFSPVNSSSRKSRSMKISEDTTSLKSPRKESVAVANSSVKKDDFPSTEISAVFDPLQEVQQVLRKRISQINSPPTICGYEKERKYVS